MLHLKEKLKKNQILENVSFQDISAEGLGIGRTTDNIVVFCEGAIPQDIAHVKITKVKGSYVIGELFQLTQASPYRTASFCRHFGYCGGCKWQHLSYEAQLQFKKKFVIDSLTRIGNLKFQEIQEPLKSPQTKYYRNKLEFTFSNKRWIEPEYFSKENSIQLPALGFHISHAYNKVLDIQECFLQNDLSNNIRNFVREYAIKNEIPFFDINKHEGLLRTLTIRNTTINEWMVILGVYEIQQDSLFPLLDAIYDKFPFITSLYYAHLFMANESLSNGKLYLYKGKRYIIEQLGDLQFKISPLSFFQTNSLQAKAMYDTVLKIVHLTQQEVVYDLYCGTGTIALYLAKYAKKVIGVEYVNDAVQDAKENAKLNNISNAQFYVGNIKDIFTDEFVYTNGHPDAIVIDPPRAGLDKEVINQIRKLSPKKIIYVSCNPPSQARDLSILSDIYEIKYIQPIDMFPHTTHIENIIMLEKIDNS